MSKLLLNCACKAGEKLITDPMVQETVKTACVEGAKTAAVAAKGIAVKAGTALLASPAAIIAAGFVVAVGIAVAAEYLSGDDDNCSYYSDEHAGFHFNML
ncbi:MAG: hypothetical protein LUD76_11350 [Alistipes sp.]|nr:hypothetical protein [Alistipes sp.]